MWKLTQNEKGRFFKLQIGKVKLLVTTRDGITPLEVEGIKGEPVNLKQIHSSRIFLVNEFFPRKGVMGDGLITGKKALPIGVKTADCYPVFIFDKNFRVVSVLHAGWRGTRLKIVYKAVKIIRDYLGIPPGNLVAAFGPGIGAENYEVGEDVARFFDVGVVRKDGKIFLDLFKENKRQLEDAGVREILPPPGDTFKDSSLFYSYRRDGKIKGLLWSIIEIGGEHG